MKMKIFSLLSLSILMLVMVMSLGSAAITLTVSSQPAILTETQNSTSFTISSIGNELFNITSPTNPVNETIEDSDGHKVILTITPPVNLSNITQATFDVIATSISDDFNLAKESTTITINAENASSSSDTDTETVTIYFETPFCEYENPGELNIYIDDISVEGGFGDDEEYWYPFDEIEIDLVIEPGDYDIENIEVKWELYTESGGKIDDGKESDFDLDWDDDDEELIIKFKLDNKLSKLKGEDKLVFYVKAEGKIDDNDAGSDNKKETCEWDSEEVELITNDNFVILDDFQFPEVVSCGSDIQITADVWNIGDDEQDDVYVLVYNQELELFEEEIEIGDIDDFDDKELVFEFQIPEDAKEKWYTLEFTVYDDGNDIYENDNDDEAEFTISFKVEGSCVVEPQVVVSASLESGGNAGEELVIKATVTNTGSKLVTYELNPIDYADWATLISVEPSSVILSAGESKDVLVTFDVNKDVSGDKLFNIELLLEDEQVIKQPVSVTIEESDSGFGFITGNIISESNWYLWGIGALNVILIVVIILVALRVAKK